MHAACLAGGHDPAKRSIPMKRAYLLSSALLTLAFLAGCDAGPKSGRGFVFPEGDAARGQKAFVDLKCHECHRVDRVDGLPAPTVAPDKVVLLGGEVYALRTYGDLVTAVIHPAQARTAGLPGTGDMPQVNGTMTVAQMLDIVTFLHPHYRSLPPLQDNYSGH
jgi:mono/diheme cytochrome c family protein